MIEQAPSTLGFCVGDMAPSQSLPQEKYIVALDLKNNSMCGKCRVLEI